MLAECRLIGHRFLPNQADPQATTHFTATVHLAKEHAQTWVAKQFVAPDLSGIKPADIYRIYFHGPAYQVVDEAWWDGQRAIGRLAKGLPPNHHPSELPTLIEPRLIELCFQTAGIWELGAQSRMGLPQHVAEVSLLRAPSPHEEDRLYAVVTSGAVQGTYNAEVLDTKGNCYLHLTGYQTVALPGRIEPDRLKALQTSIAREAVLVA